MSLLKTLTLVSQLLDKEKIHHALIGGLALAAYGVERATIDIDLLIDGSLKKETKNAFLDASFKVFFESDEVLQFSGPGQVDILFANRTISKNLLKTAKVIEDFPLPVVSAEGLIGLKIQAYKNNITREFKDKADIQALIEQNPNLDFDDVKAYADLFDEWHFIQNLREQI